MPPRPQTDFAALLARADVSQAAFARLTGMTPRQVNKWARGRATVPRWAVLLAVLLQDHSPEALTIAVEEARQEIAAADPEPPAPLVVKPGQGFNIALGATSPSLKP